MTARTATSVPCFGTASAFALGNDDAYSRWREDKLQHYPTRIEDLVVEVKNPAQITDSEREALLGRCKRANMAIYVTNHVDEDSQITRQIGQQFGLTRLDANWLADEDGISSLRVADAGTRTEYIPYTDRAIRWHTDGYYNPPSRRIWAMILHCVRDASRGGDNSLLDHELAYILLRDANPEFVRVLMAEDAMEIPARHDAGRVVRASETGPVFHVCKETGHLHMRYTARTTSIKWRQDPLTREAVSRLEQLLDSSNPWILHARLSPGSGLLCNNVLHDRTAFVDSESTPRLLYRARYFDRIN